MLDEELKEEVKNTSERSENCFFLIGSSTGINRFEGFNWSQLNAR